MNYVNQIFPIAKSALPAAGAAFAYTAVTGHQLDISMPLVFLAADMAATPVAVYITMGSAFGTFPVKNKYALKLVGVSLYTATNYVAANMLLGMEPQHALAAGLVSGMVVVFI